MRMQALEVGHVHVPRRHPRIGGEHRCHPARGILAEHQVRGVGLGEGLLVLALHRGLHRRAQRRLDRVHQRRQRELGERGAQLHAHPRAAALRMRGRRQSARRRQPVAHQRVRQRPGAGKIGFEARGVGLPRQRRRGRAGARIVHREPQPQRQVAVAQLGFDLDRVTLPARMRAHQRRPQQQVFVAQAQARAGRQALLRRDAGIQQPAQPGGGQRFVGQLVLQQQVQARHVDAAGAGIAQVHRDIDLGRDQQRACVAAGQPDRQGQRLHADPVQRARQRRRLVGDVGQGLRVLGRTRFHAAILPAPA